MDVAEQDLEGMEELAAKRSVAKFIAVKAGNLVACNEHSTVYVDKGDAAALGHAYRVTGSLFAGHQALIKQLKSKEEIIATIKSVVEDTSAECYCCSKFKYN